MKSKIAIITNVLDFVGPPAVEALLEDSYTVIAHDSAFQDVQIKKNMRSKINVQFQYISKNRKIWLSTHGIQMARSM